jgi:hypothetical protein
MRHYLPRVLGALLLAAALILLVLAPPAGQFGIFHLYGFLACLVVGILLIIGLIGTHPAASRLRLQAEAGIGRTGPLCPVTARIFSYTNKSAGQLTATALCLLLGLSLVALGLIVAGRFPGSTLSRIMVGFPPLIGGMIAIWFPTRQLGMFVKVDHQGITARLYFSSIRMPWAEIVALVVRENEFPMFGRLSTTCTIYSQQTRIDFTDRLPGWTQLADLIEQATGLTWQ